jgi:putative transposase
VHLIVDPGRDPHSLGRLLKRLAGRQTRRVNARQGRTGTLWEGRSKSSPIQTEAYLHRCSRYVELNPVRAGLVRRPENYRWSSFAAKIGRSRLDWREADPCWASLGRTEAARREAYAAWVRSGIAEEELAFLRLAAQRGQLTGDRRFAAAVARRTGRRIPFRGPGRPPKTPEKQAKRGK